MQTPNRKITKSVQGKVKKMVEISTKGWVKPIPHFLYIVLILCHLAESRDKLRPPNVGWCILLHRNFESFLAFLPLLLVVSNFT